ncbi:MAG: cysteine desulfurase [Paludibacteraceae bacterium]|nr:cysteine desulfurase [Paludibacteraceae bacterium]
MDIQQIRQDFPILTERVYNHPLVYLDNAATTQKPQCVIDRIVAAYTHCNANIHRGVHYMSLRATEYHEQARQTVADFISAASPEDIVFTRGTTEAINLAAFSYGEQFVHEGDEIIVSQAEHHSNFVPWQMLCERKHAVLRVIPLLDNGHLDMQAFSRMLCDRTRLVAVAHVSNVTGIINPVDEIIRMAHERGIHVLIDGAQSAPHLPIDVQRMDCDFFAFSAHKLYGPAGVGVLYGRHDLLDQMPPYQGGGEMIKTVTINRTTYNELPYKFEAGTPDYVGSTALAEAIRYIRQIGWEQIEQHEAGLVRYAEQRIREIDGVRVIGETDHRIGVISFVVEGTHPYDVGELLDKLGFAVRTGHHCAQPLIDRYALPGTVRISFGIYNTHDEIDAFAAALKRVVSMLR